MPTTALPPVTARGVDLPTGEADFGFLRPSEDLLGDGEALRRRLDEDGYLYLRGFHPREEVAAVRGAIVRQLEGLGFLRPGTPPGEAWWNPEAPVPESARNHPLDQREPGLQRLLFGERLTGLLAELLGGAIAHFDHVWFRTKARGLGSPLHADLPYMSRGTPRLHTVWTPLGDIDLRMGGLLVLEGSHRRTDVLADYLACDVDSFCTNRTGEAGDASRPHPRSDGTLGDDVEGLRRRLGGRWLTAEEYRMGDVVIFGMTLVHGSLDNRTERIRISTDSRYQLASEPMDERWVGEHPPGHGPHVNRGVVC